MTRIAIKRALISVYDKTGLDGLAKGLHAAGVEIVSTGTITRAFPVAPGETWTTMLAGIMLPGAALRFE